MPKWLQPVEDGFVSFMASKDLYDKFLGLIFCGVCNNEGDHCILFRRYFNGKRYASIERLYRLDPCGILINYSAPSDLWGAVHFDQIDGSYAQFNLELESKGKDMKKWGFRIICKQLEDDLKATLRDNKLIDPVFLYEVGHDSTDLEVESSHVHGDNPIEMDQLNNLQESSHMLENRLIEFDLDSPPSSYEDDGGIAMMNRWWCFPGPFLPGDPRSLGNKKYKLYLDDEEENKRYLLENIFSGM
ncbi:uncharacterized protein LOC104446647 [Eucalyptus grandis]|uniref:uncharacterized protein LOC104446647 n=1 Tax=Eucalyptus grandis TaxID=71139 RepID=UPI00192EFB34|nr:uncharacterized protein LOC104446647 [Eucalyptus grandis]